MTSGKLLKTIGLLLLTASPTSAHAQAATASSSDGTPAPSAAFTGADLFSISYASDPQISPDGRRIAYVRMSADAMTDRYRPTIWLIDVASGRQQPLVAGREPPRLCLEQRGSGRAAAPALDGQWQDRADHRPSRQPVGHRLVA